MADTGFAGDARWSLDLGDGLLVQGTERPNSPILARFFEGYDRAFVLPNEREELEGFAACLALNPECRHRFGRVHRELVLVVNERESGRLLGGANFLATGMGARPNHPPVAVALNYVFVESAARGRGLARRILGAVAMLANRAVEQTDETLWPAIFIEQNDPLKMSDADYAADTAHAGIDQIDRLQIWSRLGARLVDFPYVQPALSAEQRSDAGLAYAAVDFPAAHMDAAYLHDHLESFFGISVLKGKDPAQDGVAEAQLACLRAMAQAGQTIDLLALGDTLTRLRALGARPAGTSLREFTRAG